MLETIVPGGWDEKYLSMAKYAVNSFGDKMCRATSFIVFGCKFCHTIISRAFA